MRWEVVGAITPIAPIVLAALVGGDVWRGSLKGRPPPLDARMQAFCVLVGKPLTWDASERLRRWAEEVSAHVFADGDDLRLCVNFREPYSPYP